MSNPHVIVSAVHELQGEDPKEFWNDSDVQEVIKEFNKEIYDNEWYMCSAEFQSSVKNEKYTVETPYHSHRGDHVAEIVFAGEGRNGIQEIGMSGLEELIDEINEAFERDFTLEVYYWYDGVDKPGGVSRN